MKTREQDRMEKTWRALSNRLGNEPERWKDKNEAKKYLNGVRKTPARIHASGLGQAIAFLKSHKADDVATDISKITLEMLGTTDGTDLLGKIRSGDTAYLFLATDEAMAVCGWLSRYLVGAGVKPEENDTPIVTNPAVTAPPSVPAGGS